MNNFICSTKYIMAKFKIKYGNLIKEKATFIVNASNTQLILGSGVSKAFRQHCGGSSFQQELYKLKNDFASIHQGDVILSSSGCATNFTYALHAIVINYSDDSKMPFPSYQHIKQILENITFLTQQVILENQINKPKLVIPLLGCGTGGLRQEKVYLLIKKHFEQSMIKNLEVIVYFFHIKDYLRFLMKQIKKLACSQFTYPSQTRFFRLRLLT